MNVVALYQSGKKWSWTLNADIGKQADATWHGLSVQGRHAFTERDAVTGRAEYLTDEGGRVFGQSMTACSLTLGYSRALGDHYSTRVEYRHDLATEDVFAASEPGEVDGSEGTLAVAVIVSF